MANTFTQLETLTNLKENVKIYIPSTMFNEKINNSYFVECVESKMSKFFGGCTSFSANGSYVSDSGKLIKEDIIVCQSFTNELTNNEIDLILEVAKWLKDEMKQECISIEINNKMYFY
jgi:hypothetical protein